MRLTETLDADVRLDAAASGTRDGVHWIGARQQAVAAAPRTSMVGDSPSAAASAGFPLALGAAAAAAAAPGSDSSRASGGGSGGVD
jgi:hypothetical protein